MGLGDGAGDEESESCPRLCRARHVHAAELLEDARLLVARNPRAGVADVDLNRAVPGCRRDANLAAFRRVLHGVLDEVAEHLPESRAVAADRRQPSANRRDDGHLLLSQFGRLDRLVDETGELDLLEAVGEGPGLDAGRVEHVADELREP